MNVILSLILLIVVGSMITLISPMVDIILRQRRTRRVSESPISCSETDRILIQTVMANNPPSEVTRGSRDLSSGQGTIAAVLSNSICFNLTNIVGQIGWFVKAIEGLLRTFTTSGTPQRRLAYAFVAFIIGIQGFHSLTVYADVINLIPNPSVESANAAGTLPLNWATNKSGTNTTAFTYKTNDGHTGSKSLYMQMSSFTSGYAFWYFTPVAVKPNTKYTYSEFYKSNVVTDIDIEQINTSNQASYTTLTSPSASATAWKQVTVSFTTPADIKKIIIYHLIYQVGFLQTDDFSLVEDDSTSSSPTVSITAPTAGSTVSGTQGITAAASDTVGIAGVQFKVDSTNIGAEDTTAPYSVNWDTSGSQNCNSHTISATARNTNNLTKTVSVPVTVRNEPIIAITYPAANATLTGTVPFSASTTGTCALLGMQFEVDGVNIGTEDTSAPYSVKLDVTTLANGSHTLTAIGRQSSGALTTATETIQINNTIPNPSVEVATSGQPQSWSSSTFGTNSSVFSYLNTGHTGGHSLSATITAYTNGGALWYYAPQPVTGGGHYLYTDWYHSNVDTEVDAEVTMSNGTTEEYYLGSAPASANWNQMQAEIDLPANAVSITIYHLLYSPGTLVTDDFSFAPYTPAPFARGLVSITFDDGDITHYTNALPRLLTRQLNATFYAISGELTDQPTYMTAAQLIDLHNNGMEIGSHSVTHPDMTTLSQAALINEMSQSQQELKDAIPGAPVLNFAYPEGIYNAGTIAVGQQYYQSQRNSDGGFNTRNDLDLTRLKIKGMINGVTPAQVKAWVDEANAKKTWLILLYHKIEPTLPLPDGDLYTTLPSDLDTELQYIKDSGIGVVTVDQAIQETAPQL